MQQKRLREMKKILMSESGRIPISKHNSQRLQQRGYTKGDVVRGIMSGKIIEIQTKVDPKTNRPSFVYVVLGRDVSENPIVICVGERSGSFNIITVMPPLDKQRFPECIGD